MYQKLSLLSANSKLSLKMKEDQPSFVGSIDQGTTSSRFLIFNKAGDIVASHQIEFKQIYPQPG
jgi:glycerol kinase